MRNALYYNYGISISEVYKKSYYYFCYEGMKYIIFKHNLNSEELTQKYNMAMYLQQKGLKVHTIIKTNDNQLGFVFDKYQYVLMRMEEGYEDTVSLDEIINFNNLGLCNKIDVSYFKMWTEKLDYIEYQVSQLAKDYEYIRDSVSYFIGLAETAIALSKNVTSNIFSISHIKFSNVASEFYNPLNFIIDFRIRDISEYLKKMIIDRQFNLVLFLCVIDGLNKDEVTLLYVRMLFPNYYFDALEECLIDQKGEDQIRAIIKNVEYIETQLKAIYDIIEYIPQIEWLEKSTLL